MKRSGRPRTRKGGSIMKSDKSIMCNPTAPQPSGSDAGRRTCPPGPRRQADVGRQIISKGWVFLPAPDVAFAAGGVYRLSRHSRRRFARVRTPRSNEEGNRNLVGGNHIPGKGHAAAGRVASASTRARAADADNSTAR